MFPIINRLRYLLLAVAVVVFPACSPHVNHPGRQVMQPRLESEFFMAADGAKLQVRSWLPGEKPYKALVVAVHGFNDYSNSFVFPGEYFRRHGIACYAYDQRGFGAAPGRGLWAGTEAYSNVRTGRTTAIPR